MSGGPNVMIVVFMTNKMSKLQIWIVLWTPYDLFFSYRIILTSNTEKCLSALRMNVGSKSRNPILLFAGGCSQSERQIVFCFFFYSFCFLIVLSSYAFQVIVSLKKVVVCFFCPNSQSVHYIWNHLSDLCSPHFLHPPVSHINSSACSDPTISASFDLE